MNLAPIRILAGLFACEVSLLIGVAFANPPVPGPVDLSNSEIQKLAVLNAEKGHDGTFFPCVTRALGLITLQVRQITVVTHSPETQHAFQLTPQDGGYVFINSTATDTRFYRTDARQALVTAVSYKGVDRVTTIAPEDARKELAVEIGFWMQIASKL